MCDYYKKNGSKLCGLKLSQKRKKTKTLKQNPDNSRLYYGKTWVFQSALLQNFELGVDRYVFFKADTDTDYYRSSRPITDILNRYTCLV